MFDLKAAFTVLPVLCFCASSLADDNRLHQLESLYHYSGLHTHLSQVRHTVTDEVSAALNLCADDAAQPTINQDIIDLTDAQSLKADYINTLGEQLNAAELAQILAWTRSPIGLKVHQLEAESALFDETEFETLIEEYGSSAQHTKERAQLIQTMLANTGAVFFVSALNTESSTIVAMASLCQLDTASLDVAKNEVRSIRGEEGLIRAYMRAEFLMPTSVVYRRLSDDELNELIAFTETDGGKAYYRALIQSTRIVLSSRVDSLEQILKAMLKPAAQVSGTD